MYTIEKPFIIDSEDEAVKILDYFNGFHDGFIKKITLESNDYFSQDDMDDIMSRSQSVTEDIVLKLDIAHYNYGAGGPPVNRGVCLLFKDFYDLNCQIDQS